MEISTRNLVALKCENLYNLTKLGFMDEIKKARMGVLQVLKQVIVDCDKVTAIKRVTESISNYDMSFFHSQIAHQEQITKDTSLFVRLLSYIYDSEIKCIATDIYYMVNNANILYKNAHIDQIKGRYDFIFKYPDGKIEAVKIKFSEPSYSFRARKPENLPHNAPELICMAAGLAEPMNVALWHLKGKEDGKGIYKPFEFKKGHNIISVSFTKDIDLREHLSLMLHKQQADCSKCVQKSLCSFPAVRFPYKKDTDIVSVPVEINYTEKQQQVIDHFNGPMSVIAVPGAGKTKALVARIETLVEKGVAPSNILAVCFQRKACLEIIERVESSLGISRDDSDFPKISTFNSLGFDILKENGSILGELKLASDIERKALIEEVLSIAPKINNVSYYLYGNYGLLSKLDKMFQEIAEIGESQFIDNNPNLDTAGIISVYNLYTNMYINKGYISYDDQITLVNELFVKRPDVAAYYSKGFQYIMVDEFQDVNQEQMQMVLHLASHRNIVVVGDPKQSIFKFRRADNKYLLEFSRYFPGSKTVVMEDNFRSNDKILAAADTFLAASHEKDRNFISHKTAKYKPLFVRGANADTCISFIQKLQKQYPLGDIAVIARNNKTLRDLSDILGENDIKYTSVKDYVREDSIFLLFYDLLTLYYKGFEDVSVYRLTKSFVDWSFYESSYGVSLYESLLQDGFILPIDLSNPETFQAYETLSEPNEFEKVFLKIFKSLQAIKYNVGFEDMFRTILKEWYNSEEHPVIDILVEHVEQKLLSLKELYHLMDDMIVYEDSSRVGYEADPMSVTLLTAHDSKGKEFPVVIIYGADDFNMLEQEERYLFYVAMTRAKSTLIVMQFDVAKDSLDCITDSVQII